MTPEICRRRAHLALLVARRLEMLLVVATLMAESGIWATTSASAESPADEVRIEMHATAVRVEQEPARQRVVITMRVDTVEELYQPDFSQGPRAERPHIGDEIRVGYHADIGGWFTIGEHYRVSATTSPRPPLEWSSSAQATTYLDGGSLDPSTHGVARLVTDRRILACEMLLLLGIAVWWVRRRKLRNRPQVRDVIVLPGGVEVRSPTASS